MLDQPRNPFQPQPPRPSVILRPGMPVLPPGVERYRVAGGGIVAVRVEPGDGVTLTDLEGGQLCEVLACGPDGRPDTAGILSTRANGDARGLKAVLGGPGEDAAAARRKLERHGIDLAEARAAEVFGPDSVTGSIARFTVPSSRRRETRLPRRSSSRPRRGRAARRGRHSKPSSPAVTWPAR